MPSLPYHVYMDLDVINNDFTSPTPPPLRFEEIRDAPFLDGDSADYFCSVVRFSLQTGNSLPVFVPKVDKTATDPINTTIYKITFVYSKINATSPPTTTRYQVTRNVMFTRSVPYTGGQLPYNYYYVYNYVDFVRMVNGCFNTHMTSGAIATAIELDGYSTFPPFIEIDPSTFRCVLTADKQFFVNRFAGADSASNPSINIYFNNSLQALFPTFPYEFVSDSGDLNYKLVIEDLFEVNALDIETNTQASLLNRLAPSIVRTGIQIVEEISCVSLWNPVASIVFTTSHLPIVPTRTAKPKVFNDPSSRNNISGEPNIASILFDFEVSVTPSNQYRPDITYLPPGEYRMIDMYSAYNLNKVDVSVFWKDTYGNLNPMFLERGCSGHVKLMFRRKQYSLA